MTHSRVVFAAARPWRLAAVLIAVTMLFLGRADHAKALIVTGVTMNASGAGAASNLSIDVTLDSDIDATITSKTITITFPADSQPAATGTPWTVAAGNLAAAGVSWSGLADGAPTITGNAGARTITTTFPGCNSRRCR
ncbi:MAG: hypothetical protein WCQ48_07000 [Chloroflexota bacterium]